jgi:protein phosphatase
MVSEEQIAAILQEENDPQCACERLVSKANEQGGKDNITVIVAHIKETEPTH